MLQGFVGRNREATIRFVVGSGDGKRQTIDALVDTGFTGYLTLPSPIIKKLGLQLYMRETVTLGDGNDCDFDVHRGLVIWDGEFRLIDINASEASPLLGMGLLYGYRIQIDAIDGGLVTITRLANQER